MAKEFVKIESITNHYLFINTVLQSACVFCNVKSNCRQQVFRTNQHIKVPISHCEDAIYSQGETVTLEVEGGSLIHAALLIYSTPLFGLIIAALVSTEIKLGELESVAFSFVSFFLGMVIAKKILEKFDLTLHINK